MSVEGVKKGHLKKDEDGKSLFDIFNISFSVFQCSGHVAFFQHVKDVKCILAALGVVCGIALQFHNAEFGCCNLVAWCWSLRGRSDEC